VIAAVREIVLDIVAQDTSFKEFATVLNYQQSMFSTQPHVTTSYTQSPNQLVAAAGAAGAAAAASSIRFPHAVGISAMVDQYPITIEFVVPSHSVGAIIGKNGESRNRIVHTTGANLVVSDRTTDPLADRKISISGPLAAVQAALSLVARHIVESQ
jgi:rRNA processing protein Krr1/Pno1